MTGKTHRLFGLTAAGAAYLVWTQPHYAPATLAAVLVASHFGSLIPDIDSAAADIWDSVPLGSAVGPVASRFALGHRGLTHSLLGVMIFGGLLWWLTQQIPAYWGIETPWVWTAFMIGYILHLIADALTEQGIPLLWPNKGMYGFPPKPLHDLRIITGGWFENLLIFPALNLAFWGGIALNWQLIRLYILQT